MSAKKYEFYFVVAPGTESLAVEELQEIWPLLLGPDLRPNTSAFPSIEVQYGGLSFEADLGLALQTHFWVKIPVRVLVRIKTFFADEFFQLENALQSLKLLEWIEPGTELELKIDSQKSKLGQEKRIFELAKSVLSRQFKISDQTTQKLYLRASQNQWTISLDCSGEPLYKRNWATMKGEAPLRENLAAAGWRLMIRNVASAEMAQVTLYDPFLGSGTCLFEAALQNQPNSQREFSFIKWKMTPAYLKLPQFLKNSKFSRVGFVSSFQGTDSSSEMINISQQNLKRIHNWAPSLNMSLGVRDFWNEEALGRPLTWVFTNPPFGQRIPWRQAQRIKWLKHLITFTDAVRIGFLYPQKQLEEIQFPENYFLLSKTEFLHGGQAVDFVVLERKPGAAQS